MRIFVIRNSLIKILSCLCIFFFLKPITAQNFFLFNSAADLGFTSLKNNQHTGNNELKTKKNSKSLNLSLSYSWENKWAIEIGGKRIHQKYYFIDYSIENSIRKTRGTQFYTRNKAWHYYVGIQRNFKLRQDNFIYLKQSIGQNQYKTRTRTEYHIANLDTNAIFSFTYPKKNSLSFSTEIGYQYINWIHNIWTIGLCFRYNNAEMLYVNYRANYQNGTLLSDAFAATGTSFTLKIGYSFSLYYNPTGTLPFKKPVKQPEEIETPAPDSLNNRSVIVGKMIDVKSRQLKISVYDHKKEDNDILTLYFEDKIILENHILTNKPKILEIILPYEQGVLILHAVTLGYKPPNTAALIIDDGFSSQTVILSSDHKKSDALIINYKP